VFAARFDEVTDLGRVTVLGAKAPRATREPTQFGAEQLELRDLRRDLPGALLEEALDVCAWSFAAVSERDDLSDLTQAQADRLCCADERDAVEGRGVIVAVPRCGAGSGGEQSGVFVVAERLGRDACTFGELSDAHRRPLRSGLTFPCRGRFTLDRMSEQAQTTQDLDVQLVYFEDCPNWKIAEARLSDALTAIGQDPAVVRRVLVRSPEEATSAQLHGSPTILVNGRDPFADAAAPAAFSCRVGGAPSVEQLIEVLRR
jgi:hypothetical protein